MDCLFICHSNFLGFRIVISRVRDVILPHHNAMLYDKLRVCLCILCNMGIRWLSKVGSHRRMMLEDVGYMCSIQCTEGGDYVVENYHCKSDLTTLNHIWRGCGLWINNFTVQNCVRKIFISRQHKKIPKIAKCRKNHVINSFLYMQKHYIFFH